MMIPFRPIARLLTRTVRPIPQVDLTAIQDFLPNLKAGVKGQGVLVTANHYSGQGFKAWWLVILISAFIPADIHWVVTAGWTNSGWLTGFTHWLFPLGARLFGFTPMPAMPPDPSEAEQRATAIRHVLGYARRVPQPVIGLAPEGRDIPGGVLGSLPSGVGRFIYLISQSCPLVIPVGVWVERGCINMKFGKSYQLPVPGGLSATERDRAVGDTVMQRIAECLPERLRGQYS